MKFIGAQLGVGEIGVGSFRQSAVAKRREAKLIAKADLLAWPLADHDRPALLSVKGRFWREVDVRHNGQVGYLAASALLFLETSTLTGTP
jgi:hypothetical protein